MAATFDASLSTDKDWVRALIGDTVDGNYLLQDETIEAILTNEMNVWMAAYRAAYTIYMRVTRGGSVEDRKVGETRVRYQSAQRYKELLQEMKMRGYTYATPWAGGIDKSERDDIDTDTEKLGIDIARRQSRNPRGPGDLTNTTT